MDIEYGTDRAVVTLVSEITDKVVIDLAATMRHLRRDCFYDAVRLEIASLGGTETALSYWLSVADQLREEGLRIETCGLTFAGSAFCAPMTRGCGRSTACAKSAFDIEWADARAGAAPWRAAPTRRF